LAIDGVSLSDAGWGREGRSGNGEPEHRRRNIPIKNAVLWSPGGSSGPALDGGPEGDGPYEYFVQRNVLVSINRHLDGADRESHFGFMLGHACRCPKSGVNYSVVDTAIAAQEVLAEEASGAYLIRAWAEARPAFADHTGVLLGWYHSHRLLGLMLSESDEETNERYFAQPWQASIVVVPDPRRPLGGVFRLNPGAGVAERRRPSRFYELHESLVDKSAPTVESAMSWTNYRIDSGEPPPMPQAPPPGADFEARPDEPFVIVPLVIPGEGDEPGMQPTSRRRKLLSLLAFVLVMVSVAAITVMRGMDRAPVTMLPQVQTVHTLDQRRFLGTVDGLDIAVERYEERTVDFDAGRIGCELLATGYAAADASFVETATRFGALGVEPGREAQDAYEAASGKIAVVNTHFDGSGCPRP